MSRRVSVLLTAALVFAGCSTSEPGAALDTTTQTSSSTLVSATTSSAALTTSTTASTRTIDLLDGSQLEMVGPSELGLSGYLFTIDVPGILSSNVDLSRDVDPTDPAAVDQAAILEEELGNDVRLWRADREGQPFYMTVDLGGWGAFLHVGSETAPDTGLLLSLAEMLGGDASETGVVLRNYEPSFFTTYLGAPSTENKVHLGANRCVREIVPDAEVIEDPRRGDVIRTPEYASWCDEDADIEVIVYGDKQFVERALSEIALSRTKPVDR